MKKEEGKLGKLLLIVVLAVAMVFAFIVAFYAICIVSGATEGSRGEIAGPMWAYLGIAIALLGCEIALIMSLLGKAEKIVPLIFIAAGVVAIILMCISFAAKDLSGLKKAMETAKGLYDTAKSAGIGQDLAKSIYNAAAFNYYKELFTPIINILVFGGVPVVFGLKAMMKK